MTKITDEATPAQELTGVCTPSLECAERGQQPGRHLAAAPAAEPAGAGQGLEAVLGALCLLWVQG